MSPGPDDPDRARASPGGPRGVGRGRGPAVRDLPRPARGARRRQPAARHALSTTPSPSRCCGRASTRPTAPIRDEVYEYGLLPAVEDVRPAVCAARTATSRTRPSCAPRATPSAPSATRRPATREFPTLRLGRTTTARRTTSTSRAAPGAECRACHMLARTYMGDRRPPRSRLPHAAARPRRRDRRARRLHRLPRRPRPPPGPPAEIAAALPRQRPSRPALRRPPSPPRAGCPRTQAPALLAIAEDDGGRASCARPRSSCWRRSPTGHAERAAALLADPDPLVRAAAAGAQRGAAARGARCRARARRSTIRCASCGSPPRAALLDAGRRPGPRGRALAAAMAEWRAALAVAADFPETHLQIGGAALTTRDWALARQAFREAASLDPQLVDAWSMLVRILAAHRRHRRRAGGARRRACGESRRAGAAGARPGDRRRRP